MTILDDKQEQLLQAVKSVYEDVVPVLKKMEEDYEFAVYRAKKPIRDAVDAATNGKVPMSRIVSDATDFTYPQKLRAWLRPSDSLMERMIESDVPQQAAEVYAEDIESIRTVSRDPNTGEFSVSYQGHDFKVAAMGPDEEPWASADPDIPQGVYELIESKYPGFVVLDDDDD